ncbi:hypothetical protein BGX24_012836 [Mortierella sp. AD032]|nr:hypothetical protein BGX24_012836 [Mortierella sp. AD032]
MADTLLADACTSEDAYVQQRLCSLINCVFLRVRKGMMDELHSSTSTEDQEIVHRVDDIYAEKDDILDLLNSLALSYQPPDKRSVKPNEHLLARLNSALLKLKSQVLGEQDFGLYVELMAKANIQARDDALFPFIDKAQEFLEGDGQVMLLLGDSGARKTTFNHQLELQLWKNFHVDGPIPLYINLPTIDEPDHDIAAKQLCRLNFNADQIQQLRKHRQFILISDGYDEFQQLFNLYQSNQLNMPGQWRAKVFISCRSEYIKPDYRGRFQPPVSDNMQSSYVVSSNPQGTSQEYVNKLNGTPGLMELVQNPFLLTLALESLPKVMSNSDQDLGKDQVSRVILYYKFIEQWLEIGKLPCRKVHDGVYEQRNIQFLKDLSITIFIKQGDNHAVQYSEQVDTHSWKSLFFSPEAGVKIFRQSSPLTRSGDRYRFIHRSWLEYFYSRVVYDPDESFDGVADVSPPPISDHPLSLSSLISEPSIIQFLVERVQGYPDFKERLLALIDLSKSGIQASQAASNAITILAKAGNRFHGHDLRGIRIPGADLEARQFDSAQFKGADLTNVNLTKSWIRLADFSSAQMAGVQFGELPAQHQYL